MDFSTIGIVGGGVMGTGIAQVAALAGFSVVVKEVEEKFLEKSQLDLSTGRYGLERAVDRGRVTPEDARAALKRVSFTLDLPDLKGADLVIEAVPENKPLKEKVLAELDHTLKPEAVIATNTSGFSVTELARSVKRPGQFLGLHFFSPVPVMRVVEIIHHPETSPAAIESCEAFVRKIGKESIRVKDAPGKYGFAANRIYFAMIQEAQKVVAEGLATPADIDKVMTLGFNWPVGPFGMVQGARGGWKK